MIVDDGSKDNTKNIVDDFLSKADFPIKYIYQENSGKHIAFNNGVDNADGELFFCIDSDDYAADDFSDTIEKAWINKRDDTVGIIAYKKDTNGKMLCDEFPENVKFTSLYDLNTDYGCGGEFSLIFTTEVLRNNKFPKIDNEKFVTECVIYDEIGKKGAFLTLNNVLTICEYQEDGLSNNSYSVMLKNPTGYQIYYKNRIDIAKSLKERIGYIIRYHAFYRISKNKNYKYSGKYKPLVTLLSPLGLSLKYYYLSKR